MGSFLISYDLYVPIRNHQLLVEEIQRIGNCRQCLDSLWVVKSNETCGLIKERLTKHIDRDDKLLVVGLKPHWAVHNLSKDCTDWLSKKI
ncbi:hypothetical protein Murru_2566 [Allomuricauda ruestringensis DSM 13258]|uniref:SinR-like protein n=1 Tax=Allomuricauda ruestringensis (strain DSM 13258 / CIP 107369 / LMG 19739 / B1) TaxID=886377 RepID=G2PQ96_ALLRU|nr:hypothetical protein Murru_2566 [Allomuricauda ruestringensis DSM 13258]